MAAAAAHISQEKSGAYRKFQDFNLASVWFDNQVTSYVSFISRSIIIFIKKKKNTIDFCENFLCARAYFFFYRTSAGVHELSCLKLKTDV